MMQIRKRANVGGTAESADRRTRSVILLLAASVALMMTGYGIIMPVFARRFAELGAGVSELGFMTMAFAIGASAMAPFMGSLADRRGRRPLVLLALSTFAAANIAFLFADSVAMYTAIRFFEGAMTAGLLPAAMGVVADTVSEDQRGKWTGIVMSSYGAGFIFGPTVGGVLYDAWGFHAPFVASAVMALLALTFASLNLPETRPASARGEAAKAGAQARPAGGPVAATIPLAQLGLLLFLDFVAVFTFAFVEPQMVFYFYQRLGFSTTEFGIVVGGYGLATMIGPALLGQLSDRYGRKPIIALGFMLNVTFYVALAVITRFDLALVTAVVAGLGGALLTPALSAAYLDITPAASRSRVMGFKESAAALGGVAGPLLVAVASHWTVPQVIFLTSAAITVFASIVALGIPGVARRAGPEQNVAEAALVAVTEHA